MGIRTLRASLMGVSVYRSILEQEVMAPFLQMLDHLTAANSEEALRSYTQFFFRLKSAGYMGLGDWLWDALRFTETPYGRLCETGGRDSALTAAAQRDVEALQQAAQLEPDYILDKLGSLLPEYFRPQLPTLPRWRTGVKFTFRTLTQFYGQSGCGRFAQYRAFRWEGGALVPVAEPDSPEPWALWGYEDQRAQVHRNVQALLEGRHVNHVLLYGDSGTGKSATVKSLLSVPGFDALRLIEMDKDHLGDIPALVRQLDHRRQKFILFIDDLAFDADDKTYSQLKTILEGSVEKQRDNVVVYATSNRRNLVKQNFSDRSGDEVDLSETLAEKTSLAERFGVRIPFLALTPKEFSRMVGDLAGLYGLDLSPQELQARARQWELRHPGRTPRVARQFIAWELDRQSQP